MSQPSLTSIVKANPDVLESTVDDEMVLMDIDSGFYFGLDPVASSIWEKVKEPISVQDLILALELEFETERSIIEPDVLEFLGEVAANALIEVS